MAVTAQKIFQDLDNNQWSPIYLLVGDEPFQISEVADRIRQRFVKGDASAALNYERWDGDGLNGRELRESLETLPGLFSDGEDGKLVVCQNFDKAPAHALEALEDYFENPNPSTCFMIIAPKVDKRKGWYKRAQKSATILEVAQPYDRDWPKWQGYFEKKSGKKIDLEGWQILVESSGRNLAVLWSEIEKAVIYVGKNASINKQDALAIAATSGEADVFEFVDDVVSKHRTKALMKLESLVRNGESEIKLLALIVRQFRILGKCQRLTQQGITDGKALGPALGVHPFFVSKIQGQAKLHSPAKLSDTLCQLAECDFKMKTGQGSLFDAFLAGYLA